MKKPLKLFLFLLSTLTISFTQLTYSSFQETKNEVLRELSQISIINSSLSPLNQNMTSKLNNIHYFPTFSHRPAIYSDSEIEDVSNTTASLVLVKTTKPFFICMPPKTGCTRMKALVTFVNGGKNFFIKMEQKPNLVHQSNPYIEKKQLHKLNHTDQPQLLKATPRVLITRNPYVRFLSSYFDFCRRNEKRINLYTKSQELSFEEFVSMVELENFGSYRIYKDHHLWSISHISDYSKVKYSTILRLEEQDLWYESFIRTFDLQTAISKLEQEQVHFYISNTTVDSTVMEKMPQISRRSSWKGQVGKDKHDSDSESKILKYYTPDLARRVFNLHREDFEHFAYPAWDGDPSSFRIL